MGIEKNKDKGRLIVDGVDISSESGVRAPRLKTSGVVSAVVNVYLGLFIVSFVGIMSAIWFLETPEGKPVIESSQLPGWLQETNKLVSLPAVPFTKWTMADYLFFVAKPVMSDASLYEVRVKKFGEPSKYIAANDLDSFMETSITAFFDITQKGLADMMGANRVYITDEALTNHLNLLDVSGYISNYSLFPFGSDYEVENSADFDKYITSVDSVTAVDERYCDGKICARTYELLFTSADHEIYKRRVEKKRMQIRMVVNTRSGDVFKIVNMNVVSH